MASSLSLQSRRSRSTPAHATMTALSEHSLTGGATKRNDCDAAAFANPARTEAFDATPPVSAAFHGLHPPVVGENPEIGLIPPAMHCVNAIPYVCRAAPGIRTYLDLPLVSGHAAPQLTTIPRARRSL